MIVDPRNVADLEEIEISITIHTSKDSARVSSRFPAEELKKMSFSSLGSAVQRVCYNMLERAVTEASRKSS